MRSGLASKIRGFGLVWGGGAGGTGASSSMSCSKLSSPSAEREENCQSL